MRDQLLQSRARELRRSSTDAESHLWRYLRHRQLMGFRFRRQVPLAGYIADFACFEAQLVVELDGGQHGTNSGYDAQRDDALRAAGFQVLRFWNNEVFSETEAVLQAIVDVLKKVHAVSYPHPNPPPATGGGD